MNYKREKWKESSFTNDQQSVVFTNGQMYLPVPRSLVEVIRRDAYEAGIETGKLQARADEH